MTKNTIANLDRAATIIATSLIVSKIEGGLGRTVQEGATPQDEIRRTMSYNREVFKTMLSLDVSNILKTKAQCDYVCNKVVSQLNATPEWTW